MESIHIREGSIREAVELSRKLPEFINPHNASVYKKRFANKKHLILIAEVHDQVVGFKVGYDKESDDSFYSWMGGVLPEYRKKGVAKKLADRQEDWARQNGYRVIRFKTRNRLKGMLIFALRNGFNITNIEPYQDINENRILLEKELND